MSRGWIKKLKKENPYKNIEDQIKETADVFKASHNYLSQLQKIDNIPKSKPRIKEKEYNSSDLYFQTDTNSPLNERRIEVFHNCILPTPKYKPPTATKVQAQNLVSGAFFPTLNNKIGIVIWKGQKRTFDNILPIKCKMCGSRITGDDMRLAWLQGGLEKIKV